MAHITNLCVYILQEIFAYFYHGLKEEDSISEFRQLLPLASVCRVWREYMFKYVYNAVYLEYCFKGACYTPLSNISLFVSQRCSSVAKRLKIQLVESPHGLADIIHDLDTLGFGSVRWVKACKLEITGYFQSDPMDSTIPSSGKSDSEAFAARLTDYFARHAPNIGCLNMSFGYPSSFSGLLSSALTSRYICQLHSLVCKEVPISFDWPSFSSHLANLQIRLGSEATYKLPYVLAPSLQVLSLQNVPHGYSWRPFINSTPGYVLFTKLRHLTLVFRLPAASERESSSMNSNEAGNAVPSHQFHKLYFPELRFLEIRNSPHDDSGFYSMFVKSPLQSVDVSGSLQSVKSFDLRVLLDISCMRIQIGGIAHKEHGDFDRFSCDLFSCESAVRYVELRVDGAALPTFIVKQINWVMLQELNIVANVYLSSFARVVTQLPRLRKFQVGNIYEDGNDTESSLQEILGEDSARVPSITTNVKELWIYAYGQRPLTAVLSVVRCSVLLAPSLEFLFVPGLYVPGMRTFVAEHGDRFPHLLSLRVMNSEAA